MVRRWTADKDLDERTFHYTVDVAVPEGGLGPRLEQMVGWCNERAGLWALHSHCVDRGDFARFYFLDQLAAAAFAQHWGMPGAPGPRRAAGGSGRTVDDAPHAVRLSPAVP
jgi:hypothetical protein